MSERREISLLAAETVALFHASESHEKPGRYLAVIRNAAQLKVLWARHLRSLNAIELMDDNAEALRMLTRLASTAWPRSAQMGLNLIRLRTLETLALVLRQLERETAVMLMSDLEYEADQSARQSGFSHVPRPGDPIPCHP